jgi:hypothetical protein
MLPGAAFAATIATACAAGAERPPPVDVVIHDAPPPSRSVAVQFNPLPLIIGKLSADAVIVPIDHHALVLSPFYVSTTTQPIYIYDDNSNATQLPRQTFSGFGAEIGYRNYHGRGGPRGFFFGPSLIVASMTAKAADGSTTPYFNYGVAVDVGYEMLIADSAAITLGGGLQYTATSKALPDQQTPASIYASPGFRPRLLLSLGWAF